MSPCGVCSTPARACVVGSSAIRSNLKRLWSINWNSLVAVHTQTIIRATIEPHRLDRNWRIKRLVVGDSLRSHLAKECPNLPALRDCPQVPTRVSLSTSHLRTSPTTTHERPSVNNTNADAMAPTAKTRQSEQGALKQGGIDLLIMPPKLKGRLPLWRVCSVN